MTAVEGPWVCGNCRSINRESADRCYSCRMPRGGVAFDPSAREPSGRRITAETPAADQAATARSLGAAYRDSSMLAAVAQIAVLLVTAVSLADVVLVVSVANEVSGLLADPSIDPSGALDQVAAIGLLQYIELGVWLLGLAAWGAWLARVISNVPALGGGWPHETPRFAFISTLIPGGNLYWTTSTMREAIKLLSPGGQAGLGLITAWWLTVTPAAILLLNVGPIRYIRRIVEAVVEAVILLLAGPSGVLTEAIVVEIIGGLFLLAAAALAIGLVQRVESLQAERLATLGPAAAGSGARS